MTELPAAPPLGKPRRRGGNLIGKAAFAQIEFGTDSPLEEDGFELVVPAFTETFLLHRFRAVNWSEVTAGFDDR